MSDLFEELENFSTKTEPETPGAIIPLQEEITPGSWVLLFDSGINGMGVDPATASICVGYVYADTDFVALAAVEGGDVTELTAQAEQLREQNRIYGRYYSEKHPQGELTDQPLNKLVPITEEQADHVRFFDFKLPVVAMMTDWFRPLIEKIVDQFENRESGAVRSMTCPQCGTPGLGALTTYHGQGVFMVLDVSENNGHPTYLLGPAHTDGMSTIEHVHLVCGNPECEYNEHVDTNEVEVLRPNSPVPGVTNP